MSLLRTLLSSRKATAGATILAVLALAALLAPILAPDDPGAMRALPHEPPSADHWLGTTALGQDVLAQTLWGARTTLLVGFGAGLAVTLLGAAVGVTAGFVRGWPGELLSLLINVFLVLPALPLMVVLAAWLPPGPTTMLIALVTTGWAWSARVLRAQTLSLRDREFVQAAVALGQTRSRTLLRDVVPNLGGEIAAAFLGATTYAIGAELGLEFLGLGDLGAVTWGTILYWASNNAALLTGAWWTFVPAGLCVALVGGALALVNFGLDELAHPRLRSAR